MINFSKYKVILWDFDGVLMDSMPVRDRGFEIVLSSYPFHEVEQLLVFHRQNGGLSRYVKFRYFFEVIRKETITESEVLTLSEQFSQVMKKELLNRELLIYDSIAFVKEKYKEYKMHVVSGSDQNELRYLCQMLQLDQYFVSINGSPTPKKQLVANLLKEFAYQFETVAFIGDSINDLEAASSNEIDFFGYNNTQMKGLGIDYINSFYQV
jgi:phosphoglycolate phosphatase-like HAD superfamily hydrolase